MHEIAKRLVVLTEAEKISWSETDRPDSYEYSTRSSTALVGSVDGDGQDPRFLELYNSEGTLVERLVSSTPRDDGWFDWDRTLGQLHEVARRSALNIDSVINEFLKELPPVDDVPF